MGFLGYLMGGLLYLIDGVNPWSWKMICYLQSQCGWDFHLSTWSSGHRIS